MKVVYAYHSQVPKDEFSISDLTGKTKGSKVIKLLPEGYDVPVTCGAGHVTVFASLMVICVFVQSILK